MDDTEPRPQLTDEDFDSAFIDAVLEEPVRWEIANLTLTVGDVVQIARWLAPVARRFAATGGGEAHQHPESGIVCLQGHQCENPGSFAVPVWIKRTPGDAS